MTSQCASCKALRAQVEAVRALAENARKHAGGPYTAQVDALSIERALSSSEPVTAGPEAERGPLPPCSHGIPRHYACPDCIRGWAAGEVTPPAEQRRTCSCGALPTIHRFDCDVFEPARPTTEGGQP